MLKVMKILQLNLVNIKIINYIFNYSYFSIVYDRKPDDALYLVRIISFFV